MRTITARSAIVAMNFIGPSHFGHFPAAALDQLIASARAVDMVAVQKHLAREAAAG